MAVYGKRIAVALFGESHGKAVGATISGVPSGLSIDFDFVRYRLEQRRSGVLQVFSCEDKRSAEEQGDFCQKSSEEGLSEDDKERHADISEGARGSAFRDYVTARGESDDFEVFSGVNPDGTAMGTPISVMFANRDARRSDYKEIVRCYRPSHADYVSAVRSNGFADISGGGHFSGRLTAPLVFAGAICETLLAEREIYLSSQIVSIGGHRVPREYFQRRKDPIGKQVGHEKENALENDEFLKYRRNDDLDEVVDYRQAMENRRGDKQGAEKPGADQQQSSSAQDRGEYYNTEDAEEFEQFLDSLRRAGDSAGCLVKVRIDGMPVGVGEPFFDTLEGEIAKAVFAVPAVKGVSFGAGFGFADARGSEVRDAFCLADGARREAVKGCGSADMCRDEAMEQTGDSVGSEQLFTANPPRAVDTTGMEQTLAERYRHVRTKTNYNGGINGGLSNGMPIELSVAVKPAASIAQPVETLDFQTMKMAELCTPPARHDRIIGLRAIVAIQAAVALAIANFTRDL